MIRMKYVVQYSATFDATWDSVDIVVWSAIEQFTAMLCGSLPALRPLLVSLMPKLYGNVRDKTCRSIRSMRQITSMEPGQQMPDVSSAGPTVEGPDDGGIRVTTRVTRTLTRTVGPVDPWNTWFDDDLDPPQEPPPVYSNKDVTDF